MTDLFENQRRSIRLPGYNYQSAGVYFVTLCTQNRLILFGDVADEQMRLTDAGRMVNDVWMELPLFYPGVEIDLFQVMPNHFHGTVILGGGNARGGQPRGVAPTKDGLSLPEVVHRFKTLTTKKYVDGVKQSGWVAFPGKLWQRNYYERVVRDGEELVQLQQYVQDNPLKWEFDRENPKNVIQGLRR